jgi:hypothetical protein
MRKNAIRVVMIAMLFLGVCSAQFQPAGPFPPQWPPHSHC